MAPIEDTTPRLWPLLLMLAIVVAAYVFGAVMLWNTFGAPSRGPASFGDVFSAINALFAGLAFAGVVYAILLQRRELALQRLELKYTRQEMILGRQEAAKSAEAQVRVALLTAISGLVDDFELYTRRAEKELSEAQDELTFALGSNMPPNHERLKSIRERSALLRAILEEYRVEMLALATDRRQTYEKLRELQNESSAPVA